MSEKPRWRRIAGVVAIVVGTFAASLGIVMGTTRLLPAGAGGVNHLVLPVVAFPLVWALAFLAVFIARSRRRVGLALGASIEEAGSLRRLLYGLHSLTGFLIGFLALVVFFTGVLAVFAEEIGVWAERGRTFPAVTELPQPRLSALVDRLAATTEPRFHDDISLFQRDGGPLTLFFHVHTTEGGERVERGVRYDVDPASHEIVSRREGVDDDVFAPTPTEQLARFFVDLHIRLQVPEPVGDYVTGIVGVTLMLLLITGAVIHKRFFVEAFQLRWRSRRRRLFRDLHTTTAVWALPYAAVVAFTGAYLSFGGALLLPTLAKVAFGGDEKKLEQALSGESDAAARPAGAADLDRALADARIRVPAALSYASVHHWRQAGARFDVSFTRTRGRLAPVTLRYDATDGRFLGEQPALGTAPSVGASVASWIGPLHFGNFGGLLSKTLWAFLGVGCCVLVASGLAVWGERRLKGEQAVGASRARRALAGFAGGMPAAAFAATLAWAAALHQGGNPTAAMGLVAAVTLALALALTLGQRSLRRATALLLGAGGALALLTPFVATWALGVATFAAAGPHRDVRMAIDGVFIAIGGGLAAAAVSIRRRRGAGPVTTAVVAEAT